MSSDEETERAVHAFLADSSLQSLQTYLERGRPYSEVTTDALKSEWVDLMNQYASELRQFHGRQTIEFIEAELGMRGQERPVSEAKGAIDILCKAAVQVLQEMPPEEQDAIEDEILENWANRGAQH